MCATIPSGGSGYTERLRHEIAAFESLESVHDLPPAHDYVTGRYLAPRLAAAFGYSDFPGMILSYLRQHPHEASEVEVLSLGSGNCDFEIDLVTDHRLDCHVTCTEINPQMLERAARLARERGLERQFTFIACDINELALDRTYDLVLANHSLHHFVALERIFDEIAAHMGPDSLFLINDMIGRNGHLFWPATFDLVNRLWDVLPDDLKWNHLKKRRFAHRHQGEAESDGFEGVRAQDILPLLDERFAFQDFAPFFTFVNRFIDRDYGHNFDLEDPLHIAFLDYAVALDDFCLRERLLRPTQMLAALRPKTTPVRPRLMGTLQPADVYGLPDDALYRVFGHPATPPDESIPSLPFVRRAGRWATRWAPAERVWRRVKRWPPAERLWMRIGR